MPIKELKQMARWGIARWLDTHLPPDGDFRDPEVITERVPGNGGTVPDDGDYVVTFVFHQNKPGEPS